MIRVPSPAKLNLFLHITGRREDGYHELQTLFQLIDLFDWLIFQPSHTHQNVLISGLDKVSLSENLIYRATQLLLPYAKKPCGLEIQLEKNIPMGAGLGGGSSNAATTLIVLNHLWECGLSIEELAHLSLKLGADVPVFVWGKNAWGEGIGEQLSFVELEPKQYIILKPECFISTQLLFSQKTLTRDAVPTTFSAYQLKPSNFENSFEQLARSLYSEVDEAMQYLAQFSQAKLTGTGSCVFTEIKDEKNITDIILNAPCKAYTANSLEYSPLCDFQL